MLLYPDYDALGEYLREADQDDKVIITMLQGAFVTKFLIGILH